ncbi:hypothetical protein CRG98_014666 [Punica granatum]|uniref:DUF4283 domain-containing protein n=1 Tax=Punica granatum TaxID=22663 RepID=A0A2I0K8S4_PUNGR|nr:hypothetical protein CRG98_014666 [Punica granatum]
MDKATAIHSRLDYAKVYIEVEVEKEVSDVLNVNLGNEYMVKVLIDAPWLPEKCDHYKVFGHRCSDTPEAAPAELALGLLALVEGSVAPQELIISTAPKAVMEGLPEMDTFVQSVPVKVAVNVEMDSSIQFVAVKVVENAIINNGEAAYNVAADISIEEEKRREVDNKLADTEVVKTRDNATSSDDELEVKESRLGDTSQLRSAAMEVAKSVRKVQGKRKPRMGNRGGYSHGCLYKKLRNLKRHLRDFNRTKFGDVHAKVADLQTQLAKVQAFILESDCVPIEIIMKEIDLRIELLEVIDKEEKLLKQKSRVAWLKVEAHNTSFFYRVVKEMNARASI